MDAKLSSMLTIELARALSAGSAVAGTQATRSVVNVDAQQAWIAPRISGTTPKPPDQRNPIAESPDAEAFVSGTLNMVAFGRTQAEDLVEYLPDRDTLP